MVYFLNNIHILLTTIDDDYGDNIERSVQHSIIASPYSVLRHFQRYSKWWEAVTLSEEYVPARLATQDLWVHIRVLRHCLNILHVSDSSIRKY